MNLESLTKRVAMENGISMKTAARLMEAEARLLKEYYPQLKPLSNQSVMQQRYGVSPEISEIAATPVNLVALSLINNPTIYPIAYPVVEEYTKVIKEVIKEVNVPMPGEQMVLDAFDGQAPQVGEATITATFSGKIYAETEVQTYTFSSKVNLDDVIKYGGQTVAIRKALPEVEEAWKAYLRGEIDKHEYGLRIDAAKEKGAEGYYSQEYQEDWVNPQRFA